VRDLPALGDQVVQFGDRPLDSSAEATVSGAQGFELGAVGLVDFAARVGGRLDPRHRPLDPGQCIAGAPIFHSHCNSMAGESGKGAPRTG